MKLNEISRGRKKAVVLPRVVLLFIEFLEGVIFGVVVRVTV